MINDLITAVNALGNQVDALTAQLQAQPHILTMAEIAHGLSATGSNPLNIANLIGKPVGQ